MNCYADRDDEPNARLCPLSPKGARGARHSLRESLTGSRSLRSAAPPRSAGTWKAIASISPASGLSTGRRLTALSGEFRVRLQCGQHAFHQADHLGNVCLDQSIQLRQPTKKLIRFVTQVDAGPFDEFDFLLAIGQPLLGRAERFLLLGERRLMIESRLSQTRDFERDPHLGHFVVGRQ